MITVRAFDFPIASAIAHVRRQAEGAAPGCVLAVIAATGGPSFRPVGASMIVMADGTCFGALSSGCIDGDVAHHAARALQEKTPRKLRYGQGSPFMDIQLPCGGSLDIYLMPVPDIFRLEPLESSLGGRRPVVLGLDMARGDISLEAAAQGDLHLHILPDTRFVIFGAGTEAVAFATMAAAAGYDSVLLSPDADTLGMAQRQAPGLLTRQITSATLPEDVVIDRYTAVAMFFHSHDWESEILGRVLGSEAFYIGAQGSLRTATTRIATLRAMGFGEADLDRIKGPIGVIPSTRDPRTLAVSVLAEVLSHESATMVDGVASTRLAS
ncbi:XdhC family protein [Celeribacter ethanolicus]|uniref:Xanthine dehydrogenase n=1 Tax=Celeribacter ethanolicus TaxID=1758178 RepID=A0A291GD00_9RHOB|nr:XdhC family protein [Celeribacter ethanolicus]ATG48269.1 xanthine dehydrogenase [Celeribacter ethanolicus]TNE66616.1 MAG: XdhC family protein [Paracoccaceae bacterium]